MDVHELFHQLSAEAKFLTLKREELLVMEHTIDLNIYFVEQGCLKMYISDQEEERIIRFAYSQNIIVALDSFLSECPTQLNIQAIKKTKVIKLSKKVFSDYIQQSEESLKFWIIMLEQLVLQQIERETDLLITSAAI